MTRTNRALLLTIFGTSAIAVFAAACSDGNDKSPATASPTPTATKAAVVSPSPVQTAPSSAATAGPSAVIELSADPQQLTCDGVKASNVTAIVRDEAGRAVKDGTDVAFSVQALGTADPINTVTVGGAASTSVVALGQNVGVVVNVTSGRAAASIRVDCK